MKNQKFKYIKWALFAFVTIALVQFVRHSDLSAAGDLLVRMPLVFLGLIVLSFTAYFCGTYAWYICLGEEKPKVKLFQLFQIRHVGEMLTLFNPASIIAGDGLKIHYLAKSGVSTKKSASSVLISRILLILAAVLLSIVSTVYMLESTLGVEGGWTKVLTIVGAAIVASFLFSRFFLHSKLYLYRTLLFLNRRFKSKLFLPKTLQSIKETNQACFEFFKYERSIFLQAFFFSILHWIFGAAEFYIIMKAIGIDLHIINAIAMEMGIQVFKSVGAVVPGQVGIEEYGNKVMLAIVGVVSSEIWIVVSIMRRARQIFWLGMAGLFYFSIRRYQSVIST